MVLPSPIRVLAPGPKAINGILEFPTGVLCVEMLLMVPPGHNVVEGIPHEMHNPGDRLGLVLHPVLPIGAPILVDLMPGTQSTVRQKFRGRHAIPIRRAIREAVAAAVGFGEGVAPIVQRMVFREAEGAVEAVGVQQDALAHPVPVPVVVDALVTVIRRCRSLGHFLYQVQGEGRAGVGERHQPCYAGRNSISGSNFR